MVLWRNECSFALEMDPEKPIACRFLSVMKLPLVILLYHKLIHILLSLTASHAMSNNHAISQPLIESVAGLVAGVASTLVAHPLDVIKTRLQGMLVAHDNRSSVLLGMFEILRFVVSHSRSIYCLTVWQLYPCN